MNYRDLARARLRQDEDVRESAYVDSRGYLTIGVGRLIDGRIGGKLRPDEIDYLLDNDLKEAEETAKALFPGFEALSDARKVVLLSMAFQLGRPRLAGFQRFRAAVAAGDWNEAAAEMLDSRWHDQTPERVNRLARMMMEG